MIRDINSYKASEDTYKRKILELEDEIIGLKAQVDLAQSELNGALTYNSRLEEELSQLINSKGWRALEKIRRIMPQKSTKTNNEVKREIARKVSLKDDTNKTVMAYYNSHYEDNINYSKMGYKAEVKAIAFYLPQFHTFSENDKWWGKGFTEWTNTKKAKPDYAGHYEPREPHDDIGYYVLDNAETIKKQIELAKTHGIYGFCFYYYWFSGKRLMEKPIDLFLNDKTIDYPFCLCWANENWTRRWDGKDKEVLIEQKYERDDPKKFIIDMKKYLLDERYIRVGGKPVILVYEPDSIPNFGEVVKQWRAVAKEQGIGDILVWAKNKTFDREFKNADYIDAEFDFAPTGHVHFLPGTIIDSKNGRDVVDYSKFVDNARNNRIYYNHIAVKPFYYSCTMGWDNSPRKKNYFSFGEYSPEKFYDWLRIVIEETKRRFSKDERFIFINAWNEWAEGTYLEPDKKYGYTNINTAAKAIYGLPYDESVRIIDKKSDKKKITKKIAVQVHAYYLDVFDDLLKQLSEIPVQFDLYVSTDTEDKKKLIIQKIQAENIRHNKNYTVQVFDNVGRDVYPMLNQMLKRYKEYDIVGHFHTKKTKTEFLGDLWREHIYDSLLGNADNIQKVLTLFDDAEVGVVAPTDYYAIPHDLNWGKENLQIANPLLKKMGFGEQSDAETYLKFPVGNMFWARKDAVEDIFELGLRKDDFPKESGQVNGTIAHALERLFGVVPVLKGYKIVEVVNKT